MKAPQLSWRKPLLPASHVFFCTYSMRAWIRTCTSAHRWTHSWGVFFFLLKANKDMFDTLLCSPKVILESPCYNTQTSHVFFTEWVCNQLPTEGHWGCFSPELFSILLLRNERKYSGTLESPHQNFLSVPPSQAPSLLHGEWILYFWCQWLEAQITGRWLPQREVL